MICDRLQLQMRTLHHAVHCMDMFISKKASETAKETTVFLVTEEQYKLCAVTCILIASKSFERDDVIPKTTQFQEFLSQKTNTIIDCER